MFLRSVQHRFVSPQRTVALLLAVFAILWGFTGWRDWKSAPVRQHIKAGVELLQSGQNVAAEDEWRAAVRLDPSNAQAWELLGDYYMAAKAWPAAIAALHHVLQLSTDTPNLHLRLATCALKMMDFKTAQQEAQTELNQDSNNAQALKILAAVAKNNGEDAEQLKYLRQIANLQPQDVEAQTALANALNTRYEYEQARPVIEHILKLQPNYDFAYLMRGIAYFSEDPTPQDLTHAIADFHKVLQLNPQEVEAHRYLGRIYMRLNQPRQAIEQFEAVGRGRPYASAHFLELANAYGKLGDTQRANDLRRRFAALHQLNIRMLELKDQVAREPGSYANPLQLGLLLLRCVDSDVDSYNLYHFRYVNQDIKSPEFYLLQALALQPHNAQTRTALRQVEVAYARHLQAARQSLLRHDFKQVNEALAHAAMLRPDDPRTQTIVRQAVLSRASAAPYGVSPQSAPRATTQSTQREFRVGASSIQ